MKYYKIALHKRYFEYGYGITNYIKYSIALFGLSSLNVKATLIIAIVYAVACYFLGWFLYKINFPTAEKEVENKYNLFVKEMRSKLKKRNI